MKRIEFEVPGDPIGKKRARVYRNKKSGVVHGVTPEKTVKYESNVRYAAISAYEGQPFEGEVYVAIVAYMKIPKNWRQKKQKMAQLGLIRPTHKQIVTTLLSRY